MLGVVLSIPPASTVFVYPPHLLPVFSVVALVIGWVSGLQYENAKALRRSSNELREKVTELERSNIALRAEIVAREQAEGEVLRSRAELAHMNRVMQLGELAASIVHEIKQPLGAIMNYAAAATRWLGATPPDLNEARDSMANIENSARRAAEVIDRIRMLAKKSSI